MKTSSEAVDETPIGLITRTSCDAGNDASMEATAGASSAQTSDAEVDDADAGAT